MRVYVACERNNGCPYHGLVDEASSLELNAAIGVGGEGLGVLLHGPLLLGRLHLHQLLLCPVLWGLGGGARWDCCMLGDQLTTGTPGEEDSMSMGERCR